jgi:hypothetical protein
MAVFAHSAVLIDYVLVDYVLVDYDHGQLSNLCLR